MTRERPAAEQGFRWPPLAQRPQQHTTETAQALAPAREGTPVGASRSPSAGLWPAVERTWLGLTVPTVAQRAREAGWTIDALDRFCWRCGMSIGPFEATANACSRCPEKRTPWSRYVRLGTYTPPLLDMVHELKFQGWRAVGRALGAELGRQIARALTLDARAGGPGAAAARTGITLVPVPTTFRRRMFRGIDHSMVIAQAVAEILEEARVHPLLARRHGPSQLAVSPSEREANVRGSMRVRSARPLAPGLVVVIDDVLTTGATMTAACRPLERAAKPARAAAGPDALVLWAATLARTEPKAPRNV